MDWTITQQASPNLITIKVRGRFTIEGCREAVGKLIELKDPLYPLLFDDREVDFAAVTTDTLLEMNSMLAANAGVFAYSKMAVLVEPPDLDLVDQWRRLANTSSRANVAVFTDEPQALSWLAEP